MKDNWNLQIIGEKVILVPYKEHFVDRYHQFMNNDKILELTASEPLTLEEEYEMQRTWYSDPKKCTFIILCKDMNKEDEFKRNDKTTDSIDRQRIEIDYMAGDVNLFLHDNYDPCNAEIEIMIAEPTYRNKGFATEALNLIMYYGFNTLGIRRFFAKINETNIESIRLFERMGYNKINYSEVWKEVEYEFITHNKDNDDDDKIADIKRNRDTIESNIKNAVWTNYADLL